MLQETSDEVRKIDAQIKELENKRSQIQAMDIYKSVAIDLHSLCCQYKNEHDKCEWQHELYDNYIQHDWKGRLHYVYLVRAKSLINSGYDISIIKNLKEIGFRIIII